MTPFGRHAGRVALLAAAVSMSGLLPAATASAGVNDIPSASVTIRSITLDGYTGNIVVVARVRCVRKVEGVGSATWAVNAVQDRKAKASAPIKCDGVRRRSVLQLDPKNGRFHPGEVNMTVTLTRVGSTGAEVGQSSFDAVV